LPKRFGLPVVTRGGLAFVETDEELPQPMKVLRLALSKLKERCTTGNASP
jgi:hypothetical protein